MPRMGLPRRHQRLPNESRAMSEWDRWQGEPDDLRSLIGHWTWKDYLWAGVASCLLYAVLMLSH